MQSEVAEQEQSKTYPSSNSFGLRKDSALSVCSTFPAITLAQQSIQEAARQDEGCLIPLLSAISKMYSPESTPMVLCNLCFRLISVT